LPWRSGLAARYEGLLDDLVGLPDREHRRLVDAAGLVGEMCGEPAAHGLPETIQHDDLHDGQVYVRNGSSRVLDWGDACVSHPFFTMAVTLEGVIAWGIDDVQGSVELAPFRGCLPGDLSHAAKETPTSRRRLPSPCGSAGCAGLSTAT
jgi:hypothetical protein